MRVKSPQLLGFFAVYRQSVSWQWAGKPSNLDRQQRNEQMRLLLTTYHHAFLAPGGGETEFLQLAEYMNENGVRADFYGHASRPLRYYDAIVHFSAVGGGQILLRHVREQGKPIILIPNYNFFSPSAGSLPVVQEHFDLADVIVLRTQVEAELCKTLFQVAHDKIVVVPPGISAAFARPVPDDLFRSAYGVGRFVLWVGVLDEAKQQLQAIEALHDLDVPLIFIGGYHDRAYYAKCKAAASEKVRFLPYLQPGSDIIRSAMQSCSVYLELGEDFPGHSAIEAGLAGAPLVLRDHPWSRELLGDDISYVASSEPGAIVSAVSAALDSGKRGALVERIKQRLVQPQTTALLIEDIEQYLARRHGGA
uniref:Glycosyl transferase group 1 n=1 Tax=Rhodopseudomonas palustris (strain DX-1) TaxID=652103 RepID=E6VMZ1_RHOPX